MIKPHPCHCISEVLYISAVTGFSAQITIALASFGATCERLLIYQIESCIRYLSKRFSCKLNPPSQMTLSSEQKEDYWSQVCPGFSKFMRPQEPSSDEKSKDFDWGSLAHLAKSCRKTSYWRSFARFLTELHLWNQWRVTVMYHPTFDTHDLSRRHMI